MKNLKLILFTALTISAITITAFTVGNNNKVKAPAAGFAVVELFTSEGCSSCPPADALVARIQKESGDKPIYILAYHVDYWNHLGWRDPFSSAAYSARQHKYSTWMNSSSVYTPQIVVNGRKEFVGSEEGTLRNAIKSAEQANAGAQLSLSDIKINGSQVNYHFDASGAGSNTALIVTLVQKAAKTNVAAGENGGHTLSHVQIVRQLQTVSLHGSTGSSSIDLPKGLNKTDLEVIAFLQNQTNGQITAAFKAELQVATL